VNLSANYWDLKTAGNVVNALKELYQKGDDPKRSEKDVRDSQVDL